VSGGIAGKKIFTPGACGNLRLLSNRKKILIVCVTEGGRHGKKVGNVIKKATSAICKGRDVVWRETALWRSNRAILSKGRMIGSKETSIEIQS